MLKAFALAALLTAPAATPPPPPACLSRADVQSLTATILPIAIDALADTCRASLPANSFLAAEGHAWAERLRALGESQWTAALAAFRKIGGKDMPSGLRAETLKSLAHDMLGAEIRKDVKPKDCAAANEFADVVSPLPPDNVGRLVYLGLAVSEKDDKGKGNHQSFPALCDNPLR